MHIDVLVFVFIDIMTRGYARVYIQISLNELFSGIHVENQIFMIAKKFNRAFVIEFQRSMNIFLG